MGVDGVLFQDFNPEVLEYSTLPNVIVNKIIDNDLQKDEDKIDQKKNKISFVSGDWDSIKLDTDDVNQFDIIVSSETIYSEENYPKLINLMKRSLKKDGKAFIGAKSYYFGVGGGTRSFQSYLDTQENDRFEYSVVKTINDGLTREILMLQFKQSFIVSAVEPSTDS